MAALSMPMPLPRQPGTGLRRPQRCPACRAATDTALSGLAYPFAPTSRNSGSLRLFLDSASPVQWYGIVRFQWHLLSSLLSTLAGLTLLLCVGRGGRRISFSMARLPACRLTVKLKELELQRVSPEDCCLGDSQALLPTHLSSSVTRCRSAASESSLCLRNR
jgi:hypothetical protein